MSSVAQKILLAAACFSCGVHPRAIAAQAIPNSEKLPALPFPVGDARAIVLYFIASDCPLSNRLLPEMLRIEREFASRRVRFYFVYPNTTETDATIGAHRAAYSLRAKEKVFADPRGTLAKLASANVTPEAAILLPEGSSLRTVYTGRIDDRFLSLGTERPAATRHDLEGAIAAVLGNEPVHPPGGPPVGCAFTTLPPK